MTALLHDYCKSFFVSVLVIVQWVTSHNLIGIPGKWHSFSCISNHATNQNITSKWHACACNEKKKGKELKKYAVINIFKVHTKTKITGNRSHVYLIIFFWISNAIIIDSKNNFTLRMVWRINHSSYPISPRPSQKNSVCTRMSHNIASCGFK